MSAADLALFLAVVLLVVGFAALTLTLVRVKDALRDLRRELEVWRSDITPLVVELRDSTQDARSAMVEAREDLGRFDKVLGSAESISGAVQGTARMTRMAFATPVIKVVALASGTSRAARTWRKDDSERTRNRR